MKLEIKPTHCTAGRIAFGQMHGLNTDESYKDKDSKRVEEGTRKLTDLLQLRHLVAHPAEVHHHRRLHHACRSWTTTRRCNHCYSPGSHRADSRYAVGNLGKYLKKEPRQSNMLVSYHIPIHGASELDSVWAAAQNLMGAREGLEDIQRWFTHNSIWFTK